MKYIYLFNRLYELYHGTNPPSISPRVREIVAGRTSSAEGVLPDFPKTILWKIGGEPTREALIDLHQLISGNTAYVASKIGGGRNRHLVLAMTSEEYTSQMGYALVPPHNPGDYLPKMGTSQEQALGTEKFLQKQALFRKYTAVDGAIKK